LPHAIGIGYLCLETQRVGFVGHVDAQQRRELTLFTCAKKWDPPIVKVADDGERISRKRQRDVEHLPLLRVEDPDIAVVVWSRRRRHVRTHDRRDKLIDGVEGEQR